MHFYSNLKFNNPTQIFLTKFPLIFPARQLLTGVENLRTIANAIENTNQFVPTNSDYLSDDSDDNEGPAL